MAHTQRLHVVVPQAIIDDLDDTTVREYVATSREELPVVVDPRDLTRSDVTRIALSIGLTMLKNRAMVALAGRTRQPRT